MRAVRFRNVPAYVLAEGVEAAGRVVDVAFGGAFYASLEERARPAELPRLLRAASGLVNATPVGMAAHPGTPVDPALLHDGLWVADIVYRPLETELLRHARTRGCPTLDGGRMAVHQAAEAFRLFTGLAPDPARMRRHLLELVGPGPGREGSRVA